MKIDSNTNPEEVIEITEKTFVAMCSSSKKQDQGGTISEGIRKLFAAIREHKPDYDLDDDVIARIVELQNIVKAEKTNISIEELLNFLNSAMNYGKFQIWLLENEDKQLSKNDKLKKFLSETSDVDILRLFDIEQNYGKNNIESIRKTLDDEIPTTPVMRVNESGNGQNPVITEASRRKLAKSLIR